MTIPGDLAVVGGRLLTDLAEVSSDLGVLDVPSPGIWAVVLPFDGPPVCARFLAARPAPAPLPFGPWAGVAAGSWVPGLGPREWAKRVSVIREAIAAGDVYQVNLCRRLSVEVRPGTDVAALGGALATRHPSPHAAVVRLPSVGVAVASASPELFLGRRRDSVVSRPVKGTVAPGRTFPAKDVAENVMIVDLVRNDLGRVCRHGTIEVPDLCRRERHPGLDHLVSAVRGRLRPGVGWAGLLAATFPPGSVTGAPKEAALDLIAGLEPTARGVYCGAVGWVDARSGDGDLNVAIRTFWLDEGALHFGTGAAITWDSTAEGEWRETELKASRLLAATR
jgi:para-aminobenzoate synthetase component 1